MTVVHFYNMSVRVPMKDGDSIEDLEDKLFEAIDSIADGVVMSCRLEVEEDDDPEEE